MAGLVKLIGVVIVALGAIYLVKPSIMKKYIRFWLKKKRLYFGAALSILIGLIFLFAAAQCRASWFVVLMGIISIVKGILLFVWKQKKTTELAEKIIHSPASTLRSMALVALALGAALVFAV